MSIDKTSLAQRVANHYSLLSDAAKDLNSVSDELGKPISDVDNALKKLNLGVAVWVPIRHDDGSPDESWYRSEDIGYAKIGANWGICLRKANGDYQRPDEDQLEERWLFNDAPRTLRMSAIEKIPELLEKLSDEAVATAKQIRARLAEVQAVADAVKAVANKTPRFPLRIPDRDPKAAALATVAHATEVATGLATHEIESLRHAIGTALVEGGHTSAAQFLGSGKWTLNGSGLRIEVPGVGKKMLALTVNAAAEKIIRQELQRLGTSTRFMVVPEGVGHQAVAANSDSRSLPDAISEVLK